MPVSLNIQFQQPVTGNVGVHTDTIEVRGCYDSACAQQVSNSPQEVTVQYTVIRSTVQVSSIAPATAYVGGPAFALTVIGTNFTSQSQVFLGSTQLTTTFVSATQLTAQLPAAAISTVGMDAVSVSDATTGQSNSLTLNVTPTPVVLTSTSPSTVNAAGPAFSLTVTGTSFTQSSEVQWNGTALATTYVSPTQLTAQVPAADIAAAGMASISATDSIHGQSNSLIFTIAPAPLTLASISPGTVTTGGPAFMLTLLGAGFTANSAVLWNGATRPTTLIGTTELVAQIPAADIAASGAVTVAISDPSSSIGTTPGLTLNIAAQSIDAAAFQINPAHTGAINFASVNFPSSAVWSTDVGGTPSYALIVQGKVIVTVEIGGAAGSTQLVALDQGTGAVVWGPVAIAGLGNAAYDAGQVFVLSAPFGASATIEAFDVTTGQMHWSTQPAVHATDFAAPTAANGVLYIASFEGGNNLYALDEKTGAVVWTQSTDGGAGSIPAVSADGVYVSYGCGVYDFRPATGESIWQNTIGCSGGGGATPVVANQLLYSPGGSFGNNESIYTAETGILTGTYASDSPPAINANMGYFLQSRTLNAVTNANSTRQWSFTGDGQLDGAPIAVNQYVFIGSYSGNLYALDGTSGQQLWAATLPAPITVGDIELPFSGLSAGDGLLVVPAGTKVTAYLLSTNP